jgi:hypothetical protein
MMRGFLGFILSDAPAAQFLRRNFIFKVVPMLNPDGVIVGNLRCNLLGYDMNRCWTRPSESLQPPVHWTRKMIGHIAQLSPNRGTSGVDVIAAQEPPPSKRGTGSLAGEGLLLFCDFHAHSRSENIFMYGCDHQPAGSGAPERILPLLLSPTARQFSFSHSAFNHANKSKADCARVAVWRDFGVTMSYTMEATFSGGDFGGTKPVHFRSREFEEMGEIFGHRLVDVAMGVGPTSQGGGPPGVGPHFQGCVEADTTAVAHLSESVKLALRDLFESNPKLFSSWVRPSSSDGTLSTVASDSRTYTKNKKAGNANSSFNNEMDKLSDKQSCILNENDADKITKPHAVQYSNRPKSSRRTRPTTARSRLPVNVKNSRGRSRPRDNKKNKKRLHGSVSKTHTSSST